MFSGDHPANIHNTPSKPSADIHNTPSNTSKSPPTSLAKAEDFNRLPGEWPEGVPKAFFPWVYSKYAEPESSPASKKSCSDSVANKSWYSSPVQNDTITTGEVAFCLSSFALMFKLTLLKMIIINLKFPSSLYHNPHLISKLHVLK